MFDGLLEPWHLVIILVIVLIIFGPGKLPDLGSALGRSIKEFRGGIREIQDDLDINAGNEAGPEQKPATVMADMTAPQTTPLAAATTPITSPSSANSATATPATSPNSAATSTQMTAPSATQVMAPPRASAAENHGHACSICGTVAAPGARFCANCGNPIS